MLAIKDQFYPISPLTAGGFNSYLLPLTATKDVVLFWIAMVVIWITMVGI